MAQQGLGGTFTGRLVIDPRKLDEVLKGPHGPVAREMMKAGQVVKSGAQRRVGVHEPTPGERRARRPGTLRDSIVTRLTVGGRYGLSVVVGSEDPIALWHHEGTQPHTIRPRTKPRLVFYWPKAGGVVFLRKVNHPGTRPNRYLTDSIKDLRGRY
jgi:hypothetical protein